MSNKILYVIMALLVVLLALMWVNQNKTTQTTLSAKEQVINRVGQSETNIIEHIDDSLDPKNAKRQTELKKLALAHESVQLAYGGFQHIKMEMQTRLAIEGRLPTTLADLNLSPQWTPSSKVKSVQIGANSVVYITLDNPNIKGTLTFTPTIHQDSYIDWQCTSDIKDITIYLPTCDYVGQ